MMDVLEVYERPYDPEKPVLCVDEKNKQLLAEKRNPLPSKPGFVCRRDYEYVRHGTVNLFVIVEPKAGKRRMVVTKRRTKKDFAKLTKQLVTKLYKEAKKIVLVTDNLNTHRKEVLIEILGEKEGRELTRKIEWHYTPNHASWLNQAEIEISALSQQCLGRKISSFQAMQHHTAIWARDRNKKGIGIDWRFTPTLAKRKFQIDYG